VILLTIPLALTGSVWAMFLTGTAVNVVAHRPHHAGRHRGQPVDRADRCGEPGARARDREARRRSSRRAVAAAAIIITKLTTILGLLPMAIGIGGEAPNPQAAGITVIGGVAVASFFAARDPRSSIRCSTGRSSIRPARAPAARRAGARRKAEMIHTSFALRRPVTR
jgi:Cu/Ag efflux pump CusA